MNELTSVALLALLAFVYLIFFALAACVGVLADIVKELKIISSELRARRKGE